jgi:hypothetical protein
MANNSLVETILFKVKGNEKVKATIQQLQKTIALERQSIAVAKARAATRVSAIKEYNDVARGNIAVRKLNRELFNQKAILLKNEIQWRRFKDSIKSSTAAMGGLLTKLDNYRYLVRAGVAAAGVGSVKTAADYETQKFTMNKAMPNVNQQQMQVYLNSLSQATGMDKGKIMGYMTQLSQSGYGQDYAKIINTIVQQRRVALGTGTDTKDIDNQIETLARIKSTKTLSSGDLSSFGVGIQQRMMKKYGVRAIQDLDERMTKFGAGGAIKNLEMILAEIERENKSIIKDWQKTLPGSLNYAGNSLKQFLDTLGQTLNQTFHLQEIFTGVGNFFNWLNNKLIDVNGKVTIFGKIFAVAGALITTLGATFFLKIKTWGPKLKGFLSKLNPIKALFSFIGNVFTKIAPFLLKILPWALKLTGMIGLIIGIYQLVNWLLKKFSGKGIFEWLFSFDYQKILDNVKALWNDVIAWLKEHNPFTFSGLGKFIPEDIKRGISSQMGNSTFAPNVSLTVNPAPGMSYSDITKFTDKVKSVLSDMLSQSGKLYKLSPTE